MVERDGEFYVGYLAAPPGLARSARAGATTLLVFMIVVAGVVASQQRDPGDGVWLTGESHRRQWEGVLLEEPYPMLWVASGEDRGMRLLVEMSKRGAQDRAAGMHGARVRAEGWSLERDGRAMTELAPGQGALAPTGEAGSVPEQEALIGRVTLRGEVVDPKCFLGAMKPGDGKTHKACATLCVRGGIPPVLVTWDAQGDASHYLLARADGAALGEEILPLVGEWVEATGALYRLGDLNVLRLEPGGAAPL